MSAQTPRFPSGPMRASDADRDLAIAELSEHFQTGRLSKDEFDERSARALEAKTGRELSDLFADLPGTSGSSSRSADWPGQPGSPEPSSGEPWPGQAWTGPSSWPAQGRIGQPPSSRRPVPSVMVGVVAAIVVASLLGSVVHAVHVGVVGFGWLTPLLVVVFVLRRIARHR